MTVILKPITADNWQECIGLKVKDEQADFVPSNLYSIAEAQFYPQAAPLAIYNEQDQTVVLVLYGIDVESGKWKIFRLTRPRHKLTRRINKCRRAKTPIPVQNVAA
jgi:diamine N-acetyltransferase